VSDTLADHDIAARIRQGRRCPIPRCREQRPPTAAICADHRDELARILNPDYHGDRDHSLAASIPQLYARLDPTPSVGDPSDRRAPGFHSVPPLDIDTVVMRDARSVAYPVVDVWYDPLPSGLGDDHNRPHWEDDTPPHAIAKAVEALAEALWDDLIPPPARHAGTATNLTFADDQHGTRRLTAWCRWLHHHLDQLAARDDADDIHATLTELHDQLRSAAGDPKPQPVARCTGWVHDPDGAKVECGAGLYLPPPRPGVKLDPNKPVMRCPRCDRPYSHLMLLRQELAQERAAG
jgi:hypothetical protein